MPDSDTPPHSYSIDKNTGKIVVDKSLSFVYDPEKHPPLSVTETITSMFNTTTLVILVGFLAIYFILYFLLSKTYGAFTPLNKVKGLAVNFTVLLLAIFGGLYFYYSLAKDKQDNFVRYVMLLFQDEMNDPNTLFITLEFIMVFYALTFVLGLPMGKSDKPFSLEVIEFKSWIYLVMLIIIVFFIYVLHIEIVDLVYYEWYRLLDLVNKYEAEETTKVVSATPVAKSTPSTSPAAKSAPSTKPAPSSAPAPKCPSETKEGNKEVYNVSNNLYTYDDAQAICKAQGARLARYDEIEEAYEAGAEWCNYGWSEGQMAYFPTQKKTWEELQKDPKTRHKCGRPGINGGFINNPNIRFGVNCYGVKPPPNDMEKSMMAAQKMRPPPACPAAPPADPNVEKWKQQLDKLVINSYNNAEWSQYDTH